MTRMMIGMFVWGVALAPPSVAAAQMDPHAGHAVMAASSPQAGGATNEALPPDGDHAKAALAKSPRHGEWVDVKLPGGGTVLSWVVYPERADKAGVVIVIHEIFGMSDWIRSVADGLARDGFIAVAPDLLTGKGPNGGGTESLGDKVGEMIRTLTPEDVASRLNAVRDYALALPSASGKIGVVGFCWGGSTSFMYATAQPRLDAAVVYYGTSPSDPVAYTRIVAPVLAFYGGNDNRVTSTLPAAEAEMKKLGKRFTSHVYEGAGHGFLRQQSGQNGANMKATEQSWPATIAFFSRHLK